MRPYSSRSKQKTRKKNVAAWQIGILGVGLLAVIGLLYSLTFGKQEPRVHYSKADVELLQKQVDQGVTLNTPPENLRKLGVKLPDGYDEKAAALEARAQAHK